MSNPATTVVPKLARAVDAILNPDDVPAADVPEIAAEALDAALMYYKAAVGNQPTTEDWNKIIADAQAKIAVRRKRIEELRRSQS